MAEAALQETSPEGDELTEILAGNTEPEGDEEEVVEEAKETEEEGTKETDESDEGGTTEGDAEKAGEAEGKADEETDGPDEGKESEPAEPTAEDKLNAEVGSLQEENAKLRSYMRGMKQDLAVLKARGVRDDKTARDELEEGEEGVEPTRIEALASAVKNTLDVNRRLYTIQADQMRGSKDYSDIDDVCTEGHWDEIVDAAAEGIASQKGIDTVEARLEVEQFVWNQDNPYQYMYDTIKEYHPDYKEGEKESGGDGDGAKVVKQTEGKKSGKDKQAPGSVASMSSSTTGKSGWTSEKITNLPEADLHKVPKEIYDKYMRDELD